MKYDDALWHSGGIFPTDLPQSTGATHIGMFVAWAMTKGLAGDIHRDDFPEDLELLIGRKVTPGLWFLSACDGKFTDEDLSDIGNDFAGSYYQSYFKDYAFAFAEVKEIYAVPETWDSYDRISPVLTKQFSAWQATT